MWREEKSTKIVKAAQIKASKSRSYRAFQLLCSIHELRFCPGPYFIWLLLKKMSSSIYHILVYAYRVICACYRWNKNRISTGKTIFHGVKSYFHGVKSYFHWLSRDTRISSSLLDSFSLQYYYAACRIRITKTPLLQRAIQTRSTSLILGLPDHNRTAD